MRNCYGNATALAYHTSYGFSGAFAYTGLPPDEGLEINTLVDPNFATHSFTLDDLQSHAFNFFFIWTPEESISPDDLTAHQITAYLAFAVPSSVAGTSGFTTARWAAWSC